jgi:hypothetical protein
MSFTKEQALAAAKCLNLHPDDVLVIGGFSVDNPTDNQHTENDKENGKNSQKGLPFSK